MRTTWRDQTIGVGVLAKRIIPSMLVRGRQLIKGAQFMSWRTVGAAAQAAKVHAMRGVDELCLIEIDGTPQNKIIDLGLLEELSETCFIPITVGGGIKRVSDVQQLLKHGADKALIGTALVDDPRMVSTAIARVGSQGIVAAIDYKRAGEFLHCYTHCGTKETEHTPLELAQIADGLGVGEILLTCIDREGTMQGYDLETIHDIANAVSVPVIANGGCSEPADMHAALWSGADGVSAGAMFAFSDYTPKDCAEYLAKRQWEVRT